MNANNLLNRGGGGKPVIGVTGPNQGGTAAWVFTWLAIKRAGGIARRLRPSDFNVASDTARSDALRVAQEVFDVYNLNGIVIGGGADIDATKYTLRDLFYANDNTARDDVASPPPGVRPPAAHSWRDRMFGAVVGALRFLLSWHSSHRLTEAQRTTENLSRDVFEDAMIRAAAARRAPLLGICRGAQLLALTSGGALHDDLSEFYAEDARNPYTPLPCKTVRLLHDSGYLRSALRSKPAAGAGGGGGSAANARAFAFSAATLRVNALHHHAIKALGCNFRVAASEIPNGLTQAIEFLPCAHGSDKPDPLQVREANWWALGVQWHPEYLPQSPRNQLLFHHLVEQSRRSSRHDE